MKSSWRYYNHAILPNCAPHELVNGDDTKKKDFWKVHGGGIAVLARWTTDFDCGYETEWWYVIKDEPFDISKLKAKRRYEINKGKKNFTIKRIVPEDYGYEILEVTKSSWARYSEKYRPTLNENEFLKSIYKWNSDKKLVYGALEKSSGRLEGYAVLQDYETYLAFDMLKVNPDKEKLAINAAMVCAIMEDYSDKLSKKYYICDGSRAIVHETNFQAYLEKYFGFRKAYCKLHIRYRLPIKLAVLLLYPFRQLLARIDKVGFIHLINGVLKMEEIRRNSYIAKK